MSLEIEEQLELAAPVEKVWRFLLDPERIVTCLPGAELTKVEDPRNFLGNMKVKVGPVTVSYSGKIKMTEVDEAAHIVKMMGEGTEKGGGGAAKMTMESQVLALDGGGSRVVVKSKVDLAGKIVQFGRGMVKGVAAQLFKQFGENLKTALASEPSPAAAASPAAVPEPASAADATSPAVPAPAPAPAPLERREAQPLRLLPLIFKAMWEPIARFFRRLFGRSPAA
jgi:carbon monoxide dehydrogenase subunit G